MAASRSFLPVNGSSKSAKSCLVFLISQIISKYSDILYICLAIIISFYISVDVQVKRIGGGYGGKATRPNILAGAAAVAARKVRRPVRVVFNLRDHMTMIGWREPYYTSYKVICCILAELNLC